jgi:hypothetical protein
MTLRRKPTRQATAKPISLPSPYGGWNTLDALDKMPEEDATTLDNWNPGVNKVDIRKGWQGFATGVGSGQVQTLAEYHAGITRRLLAAGGGAIYNATDGGAAASLGSGFTSNKWQWINFNAFMLLVNGADNPQVYNGSTLSNATFTGPTVTSVVGCNVFKSRIYLWENSSQDFWYGGVNAISGAFTRFPLSRVSRLGGNLVAMGTWTLDAGDGMDDMAVFVMSSGEVIVYRGSDPGDSASWSLAGIYNIAPPLGIRTITKIGGDLTVASLEDIQTLTDVLTRGRVNVPTSKISGAHARAALSGRDFFGWQTLVYPKGAKAIVNVPTSATTFVQHVLNTQTGAWCRWTGIDAFCWGLFNDNLFFGDASGNIRRADTGTTDNGLAIVADGRQAWNRFRSNQRKRVAAVKPLVQTEGDLTYALAIGFDYQDASAAITGTISTSGTPWGSPWGSRWSPPPRINTTWRAARGSGVALSPRLYLSSKQAVSWMRTDLRIETGVNL